MTRSSPIKAVKGNGIRVLVIVYASMVSVLAAETFHDSFDDAERTRAAWSVMQGPMALTNGVMVLPCAGSNQTASVRLKGSEAWSDYTVRARFRIRKRLEGQGGHAGVRVRSADTPGVYVYLSDGGESLGWSGYGPVRGRSVKGAPPGAWRELTLASSGSVLSIWLDGMHVAELTDVPFPQGAIDLRAYQVEVEYDWVTIEWSERETTPLPPNIIPNPSFEAAVAPNLPDHWGPGGWGLLYDEWVDRRKELWSRWRRDTNTFVHGGVSMRVDGIGKLMSTSIHPQEGRPYILSAWMRAESNGLPVSVSTLSRPGNHTWRETIELTGEWKRYAFRHPPIRAPQYFLSFEAGTDGVFWVDAVQMEEGSEPTPFREQVAGSREGFGEPVPRTQPTYTTEALKIDGLLNEPVWTEPIFFPLRLSSGGAPKYETEAALAYDEQNLYIAFRCFDDDLSNAIAKVTQRNGFVWLDDSVELFIDPSGNLDSYYHLGVSITGARYDARKTDISWTVPWEAAVRRGTNAWTVEIAIPFSSLDLSSSALGAWRVNLCRQHPRSNELSAWSPTFGSFHNTQRFGAWEPFPPAILAPWLIADRDEASLHGSIRPTIPLLPDMPFGFGLGWGSIFLPGTNTFKVMREVGFNSLYMNFDFRRSDIEALRGVLDLAQEHGIAIIYNVGGLGGPPREEHLDLVQEAIETFGYHPAIRAWSVIDEPHERPDIIHRLLALAKELDPSRPAFINLTPTGLNMGFAGLPGDIVSVDEYPVHFNSSTIADIVSVARQAARAAEDGNRPVSMYLQGMSHMFWVWRGPTPAEMTAQTYAAIVEGVAGIYYYEGFPWPEDTWRRLVQLAGEVEYLAPVLVEGEPLFALCSNKRIAFTTRLHEGSLYLLALNPYPEADEAVFDLSSILGRSSQEGSILFDGGTVTANEGVLSVSFPPYTRRVWEFSGVRGQGERTRYGARVPGVEDGKAEP